MTGSVVLNLRAVEASEMTSGGCSGTSKSSQAPEPAQDACSAWKARRVDESRRQRSAAHERRRRKSGGLDMWLGVREGAAIQLKKQADKGRAHGRARRQLRPRPSPADRDRSAIRDVRGRTLRSVPVDPQVTVLAVI